MAQKRQPAQEGEYVPVKLPGELVQRVDLFLGANTWGFRTRAEVVAGAVRDFLQRHAPSADEDERVERNRRSAEAISSAAAERRRAREAKDEE